MKPGDALAKMQAIPLVSLPLDEIVYFVRSCGLVKIGQTGNARKRLRVLETQNAAPIEVIAFGLGTVAREQALHQRFSDARHHGEWFSPTAELIRLARAALADTAEWRSVEAQEDARLREHLTNLRRAVATRKADIWTNNASQGLLD